MSAVVEAVSDVFEGIVDAVGDVVETVVDVVEDAVEFVGDTVQAVIEDPLPVLLQIAGAAVGIPPMITSAAVTAARGGDLQDIVLSAGTSYFAPQATSAISSTLSASIGDAIINETVSDIVVDGVSKGLVNGTVAEIRGGDFTDGFAGGFTGTIVNSSVGEFTNEFIKPEIQDMMADTGLSASTVNTIVNEGTRALSSGLTAEITGNDFGTAFVNSVQNSTINVGTNFAVNSIGDQFNTVTTGLAKVEEESETKDEGLLTFNDYFTLDTTTNTDSTGAGIPDDLVEEVDVADSSLDTGSFSDTSTTNLEDEFLQTVTAGDYENILTGDKEIKDIVDSFDGSGDDKTSDETVIAGELPTIEDVSVTTDVPADVTEDVGADVASTDVLEELDLSNIDLSSLPPDVQEIIQSLTTTTTDSEEKPVGGLTYVDQEVSPVIEDSDILFSEGEAEYSPEEGVVSSDIFADISKPESKAPTVLYDDVAEETFGLPADGTIDIADADIAKDDGTGIQDLIEGGLNKLQQGFVDATDPDKLTKSAISGALQQVVRPAIRQGLTRAIKGTPTKTAAKPTQAKQPLSQQQLAQIRSALASQKQQPAQKIDMSKILAQLKKPTQYVPPKKVDVSKLTPVTNVASLTSILNGGKG